MASSHLWPLSPEQQRFDPIIVACWLITSDNVGNGILQHSFRAMGPRESLGYDPGDGCEAFRPMWPRQWVVAQILPEHLGRWRTQPRREYMSEPGAIPCWAPGLSSSSERFEGIFEPLQQYLESSWAARWVLVFSGIPFPCLLPFARLGEPRFIGRIQHRCPWLFRPWKQGGGQEASSHGAGYWCKERPSAGHQILPVGWQQSNCTIDLFCHEARSRCQWPVHAGP